MASGAANSDSMYVDNRRAPKKFNFWRGIYNKDKNYILGRTPTNWGKLFTFYAVFYIVLGALFTICMKGLYMTLDEKVPRWTLLESRIGDNPGLGFRPMPKNISQGSLIWLDMKNATKAESFIKNLDAFLLPYTEADDNPAPNSIDCDFNIRPSGNQVCRVNMNKFGRCSASNGYGFNTAEPCIFLKLNRIFNWIPTTYVNTTDLPESMPDDLKAYIESLPEKQRNQIFVSCRNDGTMDRELIGKITVSPRGFPEYYYPYTNNDGYLSPLVAVHFESPRKGFVINIECIAWAQNILYHGGERDRQGSIHFELMIDE